MTMHDQINDPAIYTAVMTSHEECLLPSRKKGFGRPKATKEFMLKRRSLNKAIKKGNVLPRLTCAHVCADQESLAEPKSCYCGLPCDGVWTPECMRP